MTDFIKTKLAKLKSGKALFIIGILGILLIFASSLIPSGKEPSEPTETDFNAMEYAETLEKSVKKMVQSITGNRDVTVFITLEGGPRYTYGQDSKEKNEGSEKENNKESEFSYIIVTDADGNEKALSVYESYPEVRGVTVVYSGSTVHSEKIESAVTAALGITSKRISIINKGGN